MYQSCWLALLFVVLNDDTIVVIIAVIELMINRISGKSVVGDGADCRSDNRQDNRENRRDRTEERVDDRQDRRRF